MRAAIALVVLGSLAACGRDSPTAGLEREPTDLGEDGGGVDFGLPPADVGGPFDAGGPFDGGDPDLGPSDGGGPDLGGPDMGMFDLGGPDVGPFDVGGPDVGPFDLGGPDVGPMDVGPPDLGPPDGGGGDGGICPGNTCADPIVLRGQVGLETVTGITQCAADTTAASCGGSGAPDVVHALTVGNRRRVVARAASVANGFFSALSLRGRCGAPASELVCDAGGSTALAAIDSFVDPGTYYLWLDGAAAGASGSYRVDVEIDPQDTCGDPIPVRLPTLGSSIEVSGDTRGAGDTFQASCASGARSPDHVIALEVPTRALVEIETVSPTAYDTALHVRGACTTGVGSPELACDDDGGPSTLSRVTPILDPGTYFVVVDGFSTSRAGPYTVRITHRAAPNPIRFPLSTDTFSTRTPGVFGRSGDEVSGRRNAGPASARAIDVDLGIANNRLTCGRATFRVRVNAAAAGFFTVTPADNRVSSTLGPIVASRPYTLSYTLVGLTPGCGDLVLDTATSSVTLR